MNTIEENGPVNLNGDGRCDRPGYSAKYGTYTMMSDEGLIVTFSVVQVTEVTSSNAMEKEGFERCFQNLTAEEITVKRVATGTPLLLLEWTKTTVTVLTSFMCGTCLNLL